MLADGEDATQGRGLAFKKESWSGLYRLAVVMKALAAQVHTTSFSWVTSIISLPSEFTIRVLPLGKRWTPVGH